MYHILINLVYLTVFMRYTETGHKTIGKKPDAVRTLNILITQSGSHTTTRS